MTTFSTINGRLQAQLAFPACFHLYPSRSVHFAHNPGRTHCLNPQSIARADPVDALAVTADLAVAV
jgi:hypothetical protein